MRQLEKRGLFDTDEGGTTADTRKKIEGLFRKVSRGEMKAADLKDELDRWGLFGEYEDRFFSLFGTD